MQENITMADVAGLGRVRDDRVTTTPSCYPYPPYPKLSAKLEMSGYFLLGGVMRRVSDIKMLELDGGPNGSGCWGKIMMDGDKEPFIIGDGSYYGNKSHIDHIIAGSEENPDFGFKRLREIMRDLCPSK